MTIHTSGHAGLQELIRAGAAKDGILNLSAELATLVNQEQVRDELMCRQMVYAVGEMLDRAFMDPQQQEAWTSFKERYS